MNQNVTIVSFYIYRIWFRFKMPGDSRKDYVLATIANYFGLAVSDGAISSLADSRALNNFLDDGNSTVLVGKNEGKRINFYNKVK